MKRRCRDWLSDEARALLDAGADVLVSMLTESQEGELEFAPNERP